MGILEFMSGSPFLTFFIVFIVFATIETVVTRISQVRISKNCKCNDKEIEEEHY